MQAAINNPTIISNIGLEWVYPKDPKDDVFNDKIAIETSEGWLILAVVQQVVQGECPGSITYRAVHPDSIKTES